MFTVPSLLAMALEMVPFYHPGMATIAGYHMQGGGGTITMVVVNTVGQTAPLRITIGGAKLLPKRLCDICVGKL